MEVDGDVSEVEQASLEHPVVSFTAVDYPTEQRPETKLGEVCGRINSPDITTDTAYISREVGNEVEESSPTIITTTTFSSSSLRRAPSSHPMRPPNRRRSRKSKLGPKLYEWEEPQDDIELRKKIQNAKKAKDQRDRLKNQTRTLQEELEEVTKDRDRLASVKQGIMTTIIELERKMATCQTEEDEEEKDDNEEGVQDVDRSELQVVCDTEQEQQQTSQCLNELELHPDYLLTVDASGNLAIVDSSGSPVLKLPKSLLSTNFNENLQKHISFSI